MSWLFDDDHRALQDRFGTRALADRLEQGDLRRHIGPAEAGFIEARDMFFLSTIDGHGRPTVSYKGGAPGFVAVVDGATLAFPSYDGNGMYLSMGNIAGRAQVGMLFIDFETPRRLRLQGEAELSDDAAVLARWPGADLAVRVSVSGLWVNCPRYVHRYRRVAESRYVPDAQGAAPLAGWKRIDDMQDVLAPGEAAEARRQGLIDEEGWVARVDAGDREA